MLYNKSWVVHVVFVLWDLYLSILPNALTFCGSSYTTQVCQVSFFKYIKIIIIVILSGILLLNFTKN